MYAGLGVDITLVNAVDATRIVTGMADELKIVFHTMRIRVTYVTPTPGREARIWNQGSLIYRYFSLEIVNVTTIAQGTQDMTVQVARGKVKLKNYCLYLLIHHKFQIPSVVVFGFVTTAHTLSDYTVSISKTLDYKFLCPLS